METDEMSKELKPNLIDFLPFSNPAGPSSSPPKYGEAFWANPLSLRGPHLGLLTFYHFLNKL